MLFERKFKKLLKDMGIEIGGGNPWDPKVRDTRTYSAVALQGHLGLGEAYMKGWWCCNDIASLLTRALEKGLDHSVRHNAARMLLSLSAAMINMQSRARAFMVGEQHYDYGNELYEPMLGRTMQYSCAYWPGAKNLDEAQDNKRLLIGEKLKLEPGMRVLEIGCGWGTLAEFLARRYGVSVTCVTVSKEQARYAKKRCAHLPVEIELMDYREIPKRFKDSFDRVVSVGMFEHVGPKNYRTYMRVAQAALKSGGIFLLHTIGGEGNIDAWIHKYIFPNGILPREEQIVRASHGLLDLRDWHEFGWCYAKTLAAWRENFTAVFPSLAEMDPKKYSETFRRKWTYYLSCCEATFRANRTHLWQIVFTKGDFPEGYEAVRTLPAVS